MTLVEAESILPREDPEFSDMVAQRFREEGVDLRVGHTAKRFEKHNQQKILVCEHDGGEVRIEFDALLCAVGRVARTRGYGLEELGIAVSRARTVETNEFLQTTYPNIYACGDVAGPYQFTHTAAHQAYYASVNALFGSFWKSRADYSVIPWATFTDPEVARVGLNELEAQERGIPYEVSVYGLEDLDRAIADGVAHGRVKVLTAPGKDRVLGATIAGEHAGDQRQAKLLPLLHVPFQVRHSSKSPPTERRAGDLCPRPVAAVHHDLILALVRDLAPPAANPPKRQMDRPRHVSLFEFLPTADIDHDGRRSCRNRLRKRGRCHFTH